MTADKFLDEYSGQSTDELIALEAEYEVGSIVFAFEQALDKKAEREGPDALSAEEKVVLAVEALEREVNNGGYDQFFINPSNRYAPIVVDALRRIGCPATASMTQEAINALDIKGELTTDAIEAAVSRENDNRDQRLGKLDDRYYASGENIAGKLFEFIKANRKSITLK